MAIQKNKKRGWKLSVILFFLGITMGTILSAGLVAYINQLHLPFIQSQTRAPSKEIKGQDDEREMVKFREILRGKAPEPLYEDEDENLKEKDEKTQKTNIHRFVYYLQIGAFRNQNTANELRATITLEGRPAIVNSGRLADGSTLYRVWIGPYEEEEEAETVRAQLAFEGYDNATLLQLSSTH